MNATTTPPATIVMVVPRSGCNSTSAEGKPISTSGGQMASKLCSLLAGKRSKNRATVSTMVGFISSDGWRVMTPRLSQRWLPPPIWPSNSTRISIASTAP